MLHFIVAEPLWQVYLFSFLYERRNKGNDNLSSATMAVDRIVDARRKEEVLVKTYMMVHT